MGAEGTFKRWLIQNLPKDWMMQTIETTTGNGVPDIFFCTKGYQGWIELKATLSKDENLCYLRIAQWRWFCKLYSRGGFGLLIIKREKLKRIDIYLAAHLVKVNTLDECTYKGKDIILPPYIKPISSYKLGSGSGLLYSRIVEICKKEY